MDYKIKVFNEMTEGILLGVHQSGNKITSTLSKNGITTFEQLSEEIVKIAEKKSKLTRSQREYLTIGYMMCNHEGQRLHEEANKPKSVIVTEEGKAI